VSSVPNLRVLPKPKLLPPPSAPMAVARELPDLYTDFDSDALTLLSWRGGWMRWRSSSWVEIEEAELRSQVYKRLEDAEYLVMRKEPEAMPWDPNRRKVGDVIDAFGAITHLPEGVDPPHWLQPGPVPAHQIVACANGLLDVGTRKLIDHTPTYFNRVAVPFDYDGDAPEPVRWLEFLHQLWADDPDSIAALQEFFGYVLSGRTDLHKIMLLVGPTRSGKGTIARVLAALVGRGNAAGPTLASLGTNFGLSPLLGKPLAVVSDARLGGANVHQVVERLLSVSGEDMLTIDRKYREPWTGKLPTRFLVLSNELPRFGDASGAIANRFIVLQMHESFLGRENTRLTEDLLAELPGIMRWSLDGLDRLTTKPFTTPASSTDAITALQDLVSPVAAFIRDSCDVGPHEVAVADLFTSWRNWCEENGHKPGSAQTFGRDLRAVVPQVRMIRPRDGETRERRYQGLRLKSHRHRTPQW
jgi:putative DNA primase/helicase